MEQFREFFKNAMAYVGKMTASQVMLLLGITVGSVVGLVFVVGWLNTVAYSSLYSNLNESEAGEIVTYLDANKIPYRLSNGGKTIEVPSDNVYQARINLASEGLPTSGHIGYSIFDENQLGMTDFLQNLNFRRALEGELTKTIMQIDQISAARVHLVMPKERLFREDQQSATASVTIKMKGNGGLSPRQVNGITHLVASSVEGLSPDHITIVDYFGNLISSGQESDPLAGLSTSQLEVRRNVENYLEEKAETMLSSVLGVGKAVVRVTAELNFQQVERTAETYDPNSASIRSEEQTKSNNVLSDKAVDSSENSEEGSTETTVTNYELNKTVEHIINAVGTIERLSIAVMIDGIYAPAPEGSADSGTVYQPRSQEELDRLSAVVTSAVGFDVERKDKIEFFNIAFDRQNLETDQKALDSMYQREFLMEIVQKVGITLLVLFGFFFIKKRIKKFFVELAKLAPAGSARLVTARTAIEPSAVNPIVHEKREPTLADQMQETAKQEPEEIARVIKTIMIE